MASSSIQIRERVENWINYMHERSRWMRKRETPRSMNSSRIQFLFTTRILPSVLRFRTSTHYVRNQSFCQSPLPRVLARITHHELARFPSVIQRVWQPCTYMHECTVPICEESCKQYAILSTGYPAALVHSLIRSLDHKRHDKLPVMHVTCVHFMHLQLIEHRSRNRTAFVCGAPHRHGNSYRAPFPTRALSIKKKRKEKEKEKKGRK